MLADARQALLPLLLHPAPRRALFLGLGTGVTAATAALDPRLDVDAVELLPEVIAASTHFRRAVFGSASQPRLHLIAADARRFVRTAPERYDVIVADNFHPARSGSGSLYTVEHFRAIRQRLADGGLFCQWLPLHQLDLDTLHSIVRSFLAVYPDGAALLATNSLDTPVVGLLARRAAGRLELEAIRARLATADLPRKPADFGLPDELALLGSFIAGPRALARFAGDAPLNTDDRQVVAYRAPRITYVADSAPRDRLLALLREVDIEPAEILAAADSAEGPRLAAYWSARDRFLEVRPRRACDHECRRDARASPRAAARRPADQSGLPARVRSAVAHGERPRTKRCGKRAGTVDRAAARPARKARGREGAERDRRTLIGGGPTVDSSCGRRRSSVAITAPRVS